MTKVIASVFSIRQAESMPLKYFSFHGNGQLQAMVHSKACPGGGIGRRARFRSVYRKMWRFEFSPGHHRQYRDSYAPIANPKSHLVRGFFCARIDVLVAVETVPHSF